MEDMEITNDELDMMIGNEEDSSEESFPDPEQLQNAAQRRCGTCYAWMGGNDSGLGACTVIDGAVPGSDLIKQSESGVGCKDWVESKQSKLSRLRRLARMRQIPFDISEGAMSSAGMKVPTGITDDGGLVLYETQIEIASRAPKKWTLAGSALLGLPAPHMKKRIEKSVELGIIEIRRDHKYSTRCPIRRGPRWPQAVATYPEIINMMPVTLQDEADDIADMYFYESLEAQNERG